MKKILAITLVILSMPTAFGQSVDSFLKDAASKVASDIVRQTVDRSVQGDLNKSVDRANAARNRESGFRLPDEAVLGFEMKSNSNYTRFQDEKILGVVKAEARYWGHGIYIGSNFYDREQLKDRNAHDRENEELRNPNPKGRVERPSFDVYVTARDARGDDLKAGEWGGFFRSFFSASYFTEKSFVELTVEFKEAESQTARADAAFAVIGCNLRSSRLDAQTERFSFQSASDNESDQDLRDAAARLTKTILDINRGRHTGR